MPCCRELLQRGSEHSHLTPSSTAPRWSRTATGQRPMYRIGAAGGVKLSVAKAMARKLAGQVAGGGDPAGERTEARVESSRVEARTLGAYLDGEYTTRHLSHQRTGTATRARIKAAWQPFLNTDMAKLSNTRLADHRARRGHQLHRCAVIEA